MKSGLCAAHDRSQAAAAEDEVGHVWTFIKWRKGPARDEEYRLLRECVANDGGLNERTGSRSPSASTQDAAPPSCQGKIVLYTCDEKHPRLIIPAA
ncbi:hypothetical protein GWK47_048031 [Chionoecetes opilio]|uniref:Uncharacterized protein n=1 Tax=Chionoecetes opilio TaxID=41210 RepID=A0A8J4Y389_CHIOP|nr:hypothetical protein GWK47_048031 [Chionoecetes opilio]